RVVLTTCGFERYCVFFFANWQVKIVTTKASEHFMERSTAYDPEAAAAFKNLRFPITVLGDENEWRTWNAVGDPVLHIVLRDWADLMLIAPLSANSLAKLANGLCDNLVVSYPKPIP
ncbi:unnamed protein product, partial [Sphacelaria rigidula]